MSTKIRSLVEEIEELNGDAASVSGDIDSLMDEIREKARKLEQIQHIANEKLAELAEAIREDLIAEGESDEDFDEDEIFEEDDEEYIDAQKLIEQIDGWVDEANAIL